MEDRIRALCQPVSLRMAIWIILVVGIGLRASQLALNRSLFLDEAFVATNIQDRGYSELLGSLEFDQRAPAAFLLAVKWCWETLGHDDWILRLVPFAAGVASLFLFRSLIARMLELPFQLLAMALFALAVPQVFYSSDLKQYSLDVLVTIGALHLAIAPGEMTSSWRQVLVCSLVGCAAFFCSFVSIFVLGSVGLVMLWRRRAAFDVRLVRLIAVFSMWGIGFGLIYWVQVRNYDPNPDWKGLWGDAFLQVSLFSGRGLLWLRDRIVHVASNPSGLAPASLACLMMIMGIVSLARANRTQLGCLLGPVAAVLLAAIFGIYPFNGRAILFTAPSVIILVCAGVQEQAKLRREGWLVLATLAVLGLRDRSMEFAIVGASALIVLVWRDYLKRDWLISPTAFVVVRTALIGWVLLTVPFKEASRHLRTGISYNNPMFWGYRFEELKPIMRHVRNHWKPGDKIYLYSQTNVAFEFYAERYGFAPSDYKNGMLAGLLKPSIDQIREDFASLEGHPRLWVLFTHVCVSGGDSDRETYVRYLDSIGQRQHELVLDGRFDASAYLYDLSSAPRLASKPQ